jgi:uncharacterized protein HemY
VKDEKVIQVDCESIANEWIKQRDDENFQKELMQLTEELQQLDEGKFSNHLARHRMHRPLSSTPPSNSQSLCTTVKPDE